MHIDTLRERTRLSKETSFPWFLILSLALNVAFISYVVFQWQDGVLWLEVEAQDQSALLPAVEDATLEGEIAKLATKKDEELLSDLDDATPAANGYRTQELALALLRARGYQVEDPLRPLRAWPQPLTPFSYHLPDGTSATIHLFSTLSPADIHAVRAFIEQTPVPFTSEKIVERIGLQEDSSLLKVALLRTDEWGTLKLLFPSTSEEDLIMLCKELGPTNFTQLVTKKEPSLLLQFFAQHPSRTFADLIVRLHGEALLKGSDTVLLALLPLLNPQSEQVARFALGILKEQRKPVVWQAAQVILSQATNNPSLATISRDELLRRFAPQKPKAPPPPQEKKPSPTTTSFPSRIAARQLRPYRTYVVKKGDSLWSVAKRFNVDVDKLKYLNHLKGTALSPGMELRIPH